LSNDLITEKLSFHVKSFQESFEILSGCNSLSEMAKHFDKILRGSFITTKIGLYHRIDTKSRWASLIEKDESQLKNHIENQEESSLKINSNSDSSELFNTTNLVDSSLFGIVLGKKFDGSAYLEIDKITFQIFIQLFDSAYQVLLSHKKEKKLIFSLNNRVSQLYSLIDTGIEISKINLGDQLFELALSRAIALTNSSYGRVRITNNNGNVDQIFFPPNISYEDLKIMVFIFTAISESGMLKSRYDRSEASKVLTNSDAGIPLPVTSAKIRAYLPSSNLKTL